MPALILALLLPLSACTSVGPLVEQPPIPCAEADTPGHAMATRLGILRALTQTDWEFLSETLHEIKARRVAGPASVTVAITKKDGQISIRHLESVNFHHDPATGRISSQYGDWTRALADAIRKQCTPPATP